MWAPCSAQSVRNASELQRTIGARRRRPPPYSQSSSVAVFDDDAISRKDLSETDFPTRRRLGDGARALIARVPGRQALAYDRKRPLPHHGAWLAGLWRHAKHEKKPTRRRSRSTCTARCVSCNQTAAAAFERCGCGEAQQAAAGVGEASLVQGRRQTQGRAACVGGGGGGQQRSGSTSAQRRHIEECGGAALAGRRPLGRRV